MSLITCSGQDVLRGHVRLPLRGPWSANLVLDAATPPAGRVEVVASGGLTLRGAVIAPTAGVFLDATHLRVIGGAGGLGVRVVESYRHAQLRDVLFALARASGETISGAIAAEVLAVALERYALGPGTLARALDELGDTASAARNAAIGWRVLADGTIWLGAETWPATTLPAGDAVLERAPAERRFVVGCATPWLLPGVDLEGVGRVLAVDHWIEPSSVRTWAWT